MNLITGATGLIGAHVALQLLQRNEAVVAIKRNGSDVLRTKKLFSYYTPDFETLFNKLKWVDADINDIYALLDAFEGVETVYHCAGFVSFDGKDRKQLHKINAEGTANVVNACLEKKGIVLCHVSTIGTLQNPDITTNIDESVYWKSSPLASEYAISKYNAEREVWRGMEEGLQAVIVNPGVVLGPGFWNQSSGKIISTSYKGTPFYTNGGSATVDAKDVAHCMIELVNKKEFNKRFILVEDNHSFKTVLSVIHKSLGKKVPAIEAGKGLLYLGKWLDALWCVISGKNKTITQETIDAALSRNSFNNGRVKQTLHFEFTPLAVTADFVGKAFLNDIKNNHA